MAASEKARETWLKIGPLDMQLLEDSKYLNFGNDGVQIQPIGVCADEITGNVYTGQIDKWGQPDGIGRIISKYGSIYEGQFKDWQLNGFGRQFSSAADYWSIGWWKDDQFHGYAHVFVDGWLTEEGLHEMDTLKTDGQVSYSRKRLMAKRFDPFKFFKYQN